MQDGLDWQRSAKPRRSLCPVGKAFPPPDSTATENERQNTSGRSSVNYPTQLNEAVTAHDGYSPHECRRERHGARSLPGHENH